MVKPWCPRKLILIPACIKEDGVLWVQVYTSCGNTNQVLHASQWGHSSDHRNLEDLPHWWTFQNFRVSLHSLESAIRASFHLESLGRSGVLIRGECWYCLLWITRSKHGLLQANFRGWEIYFISYLTSVNSVNSDFQM